MIFLFGVVILAYIVLMAVACATPPSLVASYAVGALVWWRWSTDTRILAQLGVFTFAMCVLTAALVFLMFHGMGGNAGSTITLFGSDMDTLFAVVLVGAPVASVAVFIAGEVAIATRRARDRGPS